MTGKYSTHSVEDNSMMSSWKEDRCLAPMRLAMDKNEEEENNTCAGMLS